MTKKDRQIVFDKYNGKCAYCGCELVKGWHVDHIEPIVRDSKWNRDKGIFGENTIAVIVDVDKIFNFDKYGKQVIDALTEKYKNMGGLGDNTMIALQNHIRTEGYDSIIASNGGDDKYLLLIGSVKKMFEPNHHILGTEQDVKMFSEFVKNKYI